MQHPLTATLMPHPPTSLRDARRDRAAPRVTAPLHPPAPRQERLVLCHSRVRGRARRLHLQVIAMLLAPAQRIAPLDSSGRPSFRALVSRLVAHPIAAHALGARSCISCNDDPVHAWDEG
eukprot:4539709-Prymnesium_polylepis.1